MLNKFEEFKRNYSFFIAIYFYGVAALCVIAAPFQLYEGEVILGVFFILMSVNHFGWASKYAKMDKSSEGIQQ